MTGLLRRRSGDLTRTGNWANASRRVADDTRGGHPEWCAHTHACGMGEHRAQPIRLDIPGRGCVVLTRVQSANGRQHAEIRTSVALATGDTAARDHLAHILTELDAHLRRIVRRPQPRP
jgi:hypothetical protein